MTRNGTLAASRIATLAISDHDMARITESSAAADDYASADVWASPDDSDLAYLESIAMDVELELERWVS